MQAAETVKKDFEKKQWKYRFDAKNGIFFSGFKTPSQFGAVHVIVDVDKNSCLFLGIVDFSIKDDRRREAAVYANMVNSAKFVASGVENMQTWGNMEVDMSNGRVRSRISAMCGPEGPSEEAFSKYVATVCNYFDEYGDGLLDVACGGTCAEEAFLKAQEAFLARREAYLAAQKAAAAETDGKAEAGTEAES